MKPKLFLCNTVYQVFVAMWIKHACFQDCVSDIMISDHMNGGKEICENLKKIGEFKNCYYVESLKYARSREEFSTAELRQRQFSPNRFLKRYVKIKRRYSEVFFANVDAFSQLLYRVLVRKNPKCKLNLYEDGLATYSKLFENYYNSAKLPPMDKLQKIINKVCPEKAIYGNVEQLFLFNPQNIMWQPCFHLEKIPLINRDDKAFVDMCNNAFGYYNNPDSYDTKYIFMEESFAAEGTPINDLELIEAIGERVGKENIMVKIHPRNPINRFKERGFKTNNNTSIPWEVLLLNMKDASEKVYITVASSSVLNPILIYGMKIKAYSLYNLVDKNNSKSNLLSGDFWETVDAIFKKHSDMIFSPNTLDDIK